MFLTAVSVKNMLADAKRKRREEEAIKRKADRRSRLSKSRRQEEEQREQARREAEEQRRADLAQAADIVIRTFVDGGRTLRAMSQKFGSYELIEVIEAKIAGAALHRGLSSKTWNFARFSNPDYDRLMDTASVTGDESKRAQLLGQAEQVLLREMPVVPIYFGVAKNLVSTRVKGWGDNLLNITYVKNETCSAVWSPP
jgi:hypothetical protein